jgi:hypothetical protein
VSGWLYFEARVSHTDADEMESVTHPTKTTGDDEHPCRQGRVSPGDEVKLAGENVEGSA